MTYSFQFKKKNNNCSLQFNSCSLCNISPSEDKIVKLQFCEVGAAGGGSGGGGGGCAR